ncbi:MAG: hypothetical protein JNL18_16860 [Planctomycetaceae bacterium]|nr:hypothetical protein [Planctomycetaceae bacterium]
MKRTLTTWLRRQRFLIGILIAGAAAQPTLAANLATWDAAASRIDAKNYSGLGPYYWFPNFANPTPQTGAAANSSEARHLPSWLHFETNPAFVGKNDDGTLNDANARTGFSLEENSNNTVGSTSVGGQANFNTLTLPGGATGVSGQAVATVNQLGNTSSFAFLRILPGAPSSFRIYVIADNGGGAGFNEQARIRVNLRDTNGPPSYGADANTSEAEALPNGVRVGQTAVGHNGVADAWAFNLSNVDAHDLLTIRPTSAAGSFPAFGGFIITPEPAAGLLGVMAGAGLIAGARRRVSRRVARSIPASSDQYFQGLCYKIGRAA